MISTENLYQILSLGVMFFICVKSFAIEKDLKAQIETQKGFVENAERIFKLYDVDNLEKFVNISIKGLKLENEEFKKAIDKMVNEKETTTDLKQRELLKFSIGFLRNIPNPDKAESLLNEYFPTNKELIKAYLKKLDAIKN